jgi:hypothetical protein
MGARGDVLVASDLMNVELKTPGKTIEECMFHPVSKEELLGEEQFDDARNFVDDE